MLAISIISFIFAGLSFVGATVMEGSIRLTFLTGSVLFFVVGIGFILGHIAIRKLEKDVSLGRMEIKEAEKESEMDHIPAVPEGPSTFLREQDLVFGPDGKGTFSASLWFEEQPNDSQEHLGMPELDYLFLELEGDYKLIRRREEIDGKDYIVYTFQSGYQVEFNQSRFIKFEEREDKSYLLEIKIGKLGRIADKGAADTLIIKATLPARINMANSMTYEDKTVEWKLTGAHFRKNLTLKAFTVPLDLS